MVNISVRRTTQQYFRSGKNILIFSQQLFARGILETLCVNGSVAEDGSDDLRAMSSDGVPSVCSYLAEHVLQCTVKKTGTSFQMLLPLTFFLL